MPPKCYKCHPVDAFVLHLGQRLVQIVIIWVTATLCAGVAATCKPGKDIRGRLGPRGSTVAQVASVAPAAVAGAGPVVLIMALAERI